MEVIAPQSTEHILQFFVHAHLRPDLAAVSRPFCELAECVIADIPRNPERTVALRKLLEAKDAAVRAYMAK
jgi:ferritin-like protein